MPTKRVLDVGNCQPDHTTLVRYLTGNFDVRVTRAHLADEALEAMRTQPYDLVLINRKLDANYSDGMDIIRQMKADPALDKVPVMLITNFAEHQQTAVSEGAELGFGKLEYDLSETRERLATFLT